MVKVCPSVLGADFSKTNKWLKEFENAKADMIQWDIMDNKFVPNKGVDTKWIPILRKKTSLFFDCHLMVKKPTTYFEQLKEFGADSITFHVETTKTPLDIIKKIRALDIGTGIAINAQTSPEKILPFLDKIDFALIMSVQAGFGGQKFLPQALEKIKILRQEIDKKKLACQIQIDGGINLETGKKAIKAGANILVTGSFIFTYKKGIKQAITDLKKLG